jgi:steroid 5-alpha reductase family enzyme
MDSLLLQAILGCAAVAVACWLLSVVTHEHSWVDRAWSIAPVGYVAWFWLASDLADRRLAIMTVLVALWGGRLTYNFARKGGYAKGGEDYRWAELRRRMSASGFAVFNVVFIHGFQNALLLLITLPAWVAARHHDTPLGLLDGLAALLFLVAWVGEAVADEQQWRFHCEKKARREGGLPIEREFLTTGLFAWSRQPNFFCEQAIWWAFALFAVSAGGAWLGVHLLGALLLTLLFQGSTRFTEELTLAKYPEYADYQRTTPMLLPRPRLRSR